MTTTDALKSLTAGQNTLRNLTSLLKVMLIAAEAQESGFTGKTPPDWWELLELAHERVSSIPDFLDQVEIFLRKQEIDQ